ncbi:hypothetical protein ABI59_07995 [Acidobacteria bacterium Mor1]|nr:hypothetical protein ABI59_07995 [Acidobacteria bacterium Mor1]
MRLFAVAPRNFSIRLSLIAALVLTALCSVSAQETWYEDVENQPVTDHLSVVATAPGVPEGSIFAGFENSENVSMFGGNLLVSHPSSPSFSLDGGSSVGLTRVYNSKKAIYDNYVTNDCIGMTWEQDVQGGDSWVGYGWTMHLGRFYQKSDMDRQRAECLPQNSPDPQPDPTLYSFGCQSFEDSQGTTMDGSQAHPNVLFEATLTAAEACGPQNSCGCPMFGEEGFDPQCFVDCTTCWANHTASYTSWDVTFPDGTLYRTKELIQPDQSNPAQFVENHNRVGWYTKEIFDVYGNAGVLVEYWGEDEAACIAEVGGTTCPYPEAIRSIKVKREGLVPPGADGNDYLEVIWTELGPSTDPASAGRLHKLHALGFNGQTVTYEYSYRSETFDGYTVSVLTGVDLPAIGGQPAGTIDYDYTDAPLGTSVNTYQSKYGLMLDEIHYPLGGMSKYEYTQYTPGVVEQAIKNFTAPDSWVESHRPLDRMDYAVSKRTMYPVRDETTGNHDPAYHYDWTWERSFKTDWDEHNPSGNCVTWATVQDFSMTNPDGTKTEFEFTGHACGDEYINPGNDEPQGHTKQETTFDAAGTPLRTSVKEYDWDVTGKCGTGSGDQASKVLERSTTTTFHDDTGTCFGGTSGGAARTTTTTSYGLNSDKYWTTRRLTSDYLPDDRVSHTNYVTSTCQRDNHVLGRYDWVTMIEGSGTDNRSSRRFAFDCEGALTERRSLPDWEDDSSVPTTETYATWDAWSPAAPPSTTPNDLISQHAYTSAGNLQQVDFSGGDTYPGGSTRSTYAAQFTWNYGQATNLKVGDGTSFLPYDSQSVTLDPAGFVSSSQDPNGVTTQFTYDALGRLEEIDPASTEHSTRINYPDLTETRVIHGGSASDVDLADGQQLYSDMTFDGLGRIIEERKVVPGTSGSQDTISVRLVRYDMMGRQVFQSDWIAESELTPLASRPTWDWTDTLTGETYSIDYVTWDDGGVTRPRGVVTFYGTPSTVSGEENNPLLVTADAMGRVHKVLAADGSITETAYCGPHREVTVHGVQTAAPSTGNDGRSNVTTRYYHDALDRLVLVDVEPLAENTTDPVVGADAEYFYDPLGNLVYVNLIDRLPQNPFEAWFADTIGSGQERTYEYDAVGRLRESTNPENGTTTVEAYDVLGNVLASRDQLGAATHRGYYFKNTYDMAGRIVEASRVFDGGGTSDVLSGAGGFESGTTGWEVGTINESTQDFTSGTSYWTTLDYASSSCSVPAPPGSTSTAGLYFGDTSNCSYASATDVQHALRKQITLGREDMLRFKFWRQVRGGTGDLDKFRIYVTDSNQGLSTTNRRNLLEVDQNQASFGVWREAQAMRPSDVFSTAEWADNASKTIYVYLVFDKGDAATANIGTGLVIDDMTVSKAASELLAEYVYDSPNTCDGTSGELGGAACDHGPESNSYLGQLAQLKSYQEGRLAARKTLVYQGLNGRLSGVRTEIDWKGTGDFADFVTGYSYQDHGKPATWTAPYQPGIETGRDYVYTHTRGLLNGLEQADYDFIAPNSHSVHYSAAGALNKITFGNGATSEITRDIVGRPSNMLATAPWASPSNTVWASGAFEYDGAGNIAAIGGQTYVYDVVGRLVEANVLPQATDPDGDANNVRYTYDLYGNMTSRDWGHDGNFAATGTPADFEFFGRQHIETAAPVENNRIHDTGFAYDANGNMTRYMKDGGGVGSTWTSQGRMSAYYAANPETSGGVVAERYVYDADGYRLVQYPDSPHTGDGVPLLSIRDAAGQLLAQFEHKPLEASPTLKKEFVSGLGQLLVERDVVEAPSSVSTNSALESGGSYGFQVLDNPVASEYTIDIRTHSGIVAQLQNQAPDGSGVLWIPSTNFTDADTNFIRVRKQDGSTSYSAPVTLSPDSSVTGSSANQVRAISSARVGANVEIRWDLLQQNGQTTYVHFERADGGGTILLTPLGVPSGVTSLSLLHQALSAPCGTVFTTTSPSSTLNPSVGAETKNFGHLENTAEPPCGTPPSPTPGYSLANSYHHRDHLGSLRVVTDEAGAKKSSHDYYPFGGELGATGGPSFRRFTGHERDISSGMDYMLARFGSGGLGRFLAVDPAVESALPQVPQTWHRYSYTFNNPVLLVDPDGEIVATASGAAVGGVFSGAVALFQGKSWKEVRNAAIGGAITGAMVGSVVDTGGASLGVMVAAGSISSVAGGMVEDALNGQAPTVESVVVDAAGGAAGAMLGGIADEALDIASSATRSLSRRGAQSRAESALGDELAELARAPASMRPATVVGAANRRTGEAVVGRSYPGPKGCCAEVDAAQKLGGKARDIVFTKPVRPRNGKLIPVCEACGLRFDVSQFPPGTKFQGPR